MTPIATGIIKKNIVMYRPTKRSQSDGSYLANVPALNPIAIVTFSLAVKPLALVLNDAPLLVSWQGVVEPLQPW